VCVPIYIHTLGFSCAAILAPAPPKRLSSPRRYEADFKIGFMARNAVWLNSPADNRAAKNRFAFLDNFMPFRSQSPGDAFDTTGIFRISVHRRF